MGLPQDRKTVAKPSGLMVGGQEMAAYSNHDQAIHDMILWFKYWEPDGSNPFPPNLTQIEDFVNMLKSRRYFEDTAPRYLNGLNRYL